MVKISAVVEGWRRGKLASRKHDAVDSTEAECSFKVRVQPFGLTHL